MPAHIIPLTVKILATVFFKCLSRAKYVPHAGQMDSYLCAIDFQPVECWGQTVTQNPRLLGLRDWRYHYLTQLSFYS